MGLMLECDLDCCVLQLVAMNNNPLHTRVILGGVELCPFTWPLGLKSIKGTTPSFGLTPSPYVRDRLVFPPAHLTPLGKTEVDWMGCGLANK